MFFGSRAAHPSKVFCDWDMLKTGEPLAQSMLCGHFKMRWHAQIHAVARAVAGCPVYASDPSESFRMDVLRPLLLPGSDEVSWLSH